MSQLQTDWQACKAAHTAATLMWEAQGKWRPDTVQPFLDDLYFKATAFKSNHGIEFDPSKPVTEKEAA